MLRGVLRRSSHEFPTLRDEIDLIRSYLDIEQARFEERLHVDLRVLDELRALPVPSLLLQPLVENAIKHGIAPIRTGGSVAVRAYVTAAEYGATALVVEVVDSVDRQLRNAIPVASARGRLLDLDAGSRHGRLS